MTDNDVPQPSDPQPSDPQPSDPQPGQPQPNEWARPDGAAAIPSSPPTIGPPVEHEYPEFDPSLLTLEHETEVRSGRGGRIAALVAGGALLLGGVGFAATQLGDDTGSPEAAVEAMFDAMADEDVLGMLAALDPGERDALRGPTEDLFGELQRLDVLGDDFRLDGISGVDFTFEDLEFRSEAVRDDLARVSIVGGSATVTYDSDEIPLGDFVTDTMDRFDVEYQGMTGTETTDMADQDAADEFIVARKGPDGWRISLGYTAAEAARAESGVGAVPATGTGLAPVGADSPEAAVESFTRTALDLDVAGLVARLSPNEFRALQDYWTLFVDEGDLPDGPEDFGASLELTSIDLRSEADGDAASVFVDGFDLAVEVDGTAVRIQFAEGCATITGDLDALGVPEDLQGPFCADDYADMMDEAAGGAGLYGFGAEFDFDFDVFSTIRTPAIGITTHKVDGGWYVAPISTYMDGMVAVFESMDREHLDAIVDLAEQVVSSFASAFSTGFDSSGFDSSGFGSSGFGSGGFDSDFGFEDQNGIDEGFGSFGPFVDPEVEVAVRSLLSQFSDDPVVVECAWAELWFALDLEQLAEIADFANGGPEPSFSSDDTVFRALDVCGA